MRDAHRLISISNRSAATYCYVARVAPAERAHQPTIEEIMQVTRRGSIGVALALGLTAVSGAAQAAMSCDSLTTVTPEASTIASAAIVTPPATIGGAAVSVPFCRVQGTARPSFDSEIKFEVWLPPTAADWTGRMKVNGTGGYAGATPYARLAQDIGDGFVTAGSNMGHDGGEAASWTLGHPEKVKDWGLRAHYFVATAAKTLSVAFYDRPVAHSYFEGCSNGGRQAMMMAQNYPELFDGIVVGAPSMFYPDILFWLLWTGKQLTPVFGQPAVLSSAKCSLITERVLAKCDAIDGLADGQITNPRACSFDIDKLGPSGENVLTAQELATVKAMSPARRTRSLASSATAVPSSARRRTSIRTSPTTEATARSSATSCIRCCHRPTNGAATSTGRRSTIRRRRCSRPSPRHPARTSGRLRAAAARGCRNTTACSCCPPSATAAAVPGPTPSAAALRSQRRRFATPTIML